MKPLALSTMYAQQERFADGAVFARYAAEVGYDAIEISHSTPEPKLQQIIDAGVLPITSVHQPAPYSQMPDGHGNSHANLAALDPEQRSAAVAYARASIAWAAKVGAARVVVHLGQVTDVDDQFEEEREMRRMFDAGQSGEPRFRELREQAVRRRAENAAPYLEAARRSLEELVAAARPHNIAIGLENRYHYHEIPQPLEYAQLLDGFALEEAGYWHDTGHAEVMHRLGFNDRHDWLDLHGCRCIGAHVHDVRGIADHRAPGNGDVDWSYITDGLRHLPGYTLEIDQRQSDAVVAAAIPFLASKGLR